MGMLTHFNLGIYPAQSMLNRHRHDMSSNTFIAKYGNASAAVISFIAWHQKFRYIIPRRSSDLLFGDDDNIFRISKTVDKDEYILSKQVLKRNFQNPADDVLEWRELERGGEQDVLAAAEKAYDFIDEEQTPSYNSD